MDYIKKRHNLLADYVSESILCIQYVFHLQK